MCALFVLSSLSFDLDECCVFPLDAVFPLIIIRHDQPSAPLFLLVEICSFVNSPPILLFPYLVGHTGPIPYRHALRASRNHFIPFAMPRHAAPRSVAASTTQRYNRSARYTRSTRYARTGMPRNTKPRHGASACGYQDHGSHERTFPVFLFFLFLYPSPFRFIQVPIPPTFHLPASKHCLPIPNHPLTSDPDSFFRALSTTKTTLAIITSRDRCTLG
jgi:hypothetical protein